MLERGRVGDMVTLVLPAPAPPRHWPLLIPLNTQPPPPHSQPATAQTDRLKESEKTNTNTTLPILAGLHHCQYPISIFLAQQNAQSSLQLPAVEQNDFSLFHNKTMTGFAKYNCILIIYSTFLQYLGNSARFQLPIS